MQTTTTSPKQRVRHCYPPKELFAEWIKSDRYLYYNGRNKLEAVGNYLLIGKSGFNSVENIKGYEYTAKCRMLAVIDRTTKRVLICTRFDKHLWTLKNSIPKDYEIFYTDELIPRLDILSDDEELCKVYCKYIVKTFTVTNLREFYGVLRGIQKNLHYSLDDVFNNKYKRQPYSNPTYYTVNEIKSFINKHKIKRYDWYKEFLGTKVLRFGKSWPVEEISVNLPTLKQIVTNTIFTKAQKILLNQRYFYTKYCFGNGIKYIDVCKYWNKEVTNNEFIRYIYKTSLQFNNECLVDIITWNDKVKAVVISNKTIFAKRIQNWIKQSDDNYINALNLAKEIDKRGYTEAERIKYRLDTYPYIKYRHYIKPNGRFRYGHWEDRWINIKLNPMLKDTKKTITLKYK